MSERHHSKVLIIGAGPAGYTAAIYAARANLHPILVTGLQPGGQLTITTDVENYPGFAEVIQGPWLMEQMQRQAEHVGTKVILDMITEIELARRPFVAKGDSGDLYVGETLIIATGAQARWLGIPSEEIFRGFGVSACATCDGFFFRGKEVVVVGGGNTAVEEAIYLTNHARQVTLIHRRNALRAEKILQERLFRNPKIGIIWDSVVEEILGVAEPPEVTGVRLRNVHSGAISELPVSVRVCDADAGVVSTGGAVADTDGEGGEPPGPLQAARARAAAAASAVKARRPGPRRRDARSGARIFMATVPSLARAIRAGSHAPGGCAPRCMPW